MRLLEHLFYSPSLNFKLGLGSVNRFIGLALNDYVNNINHAWPR